MEGVSGNSWTSSPATGREHRPPTTANGGGGADTRERGAGCDTLVSPRVSSLS
jgi:hypothetical protein